MWKCKATLTREQSKAHSKGRRTDSRALAIAASCFCLAISGCGEAGPSVLDEGTVGFELTIQSSSLLWGFPNNFQPAPAAGQTLDACFLDPPDDGLDSQKQLVRQVIFGTWEFASNIHVNWIDPCPSTGKLIRIAINGRDAAKAGWSIGTGTRVRKGPTASNSADQTACDEDPTVCPSIKIYAANSPTQFDLDVVAYVAAHEFGHALGFVHEQDSPNNRDANGNVIDCTESLGTVGQAVTSYDHDSVMNYCSKSTGFISGLDIAGSQELYGPSSRYIAAMWLVAS